MEIEGWEGVKKHTRLTKLASVLNLNDEQIKSLKTLRALNRPGLCASVTANPQSGTVRVDIRCTSSRWVGGKRLSSTPIDWEKVLDEMVQEHLTNFEKLSSKVRDVSDILSSLLKR